MNHKEQLVSLSGAIEVFFFLFPHFYIDLLVVKKPMGLASNKLTSCIQLSARMIANNASIPSNSQEGPGAR